MNFLPKFEVATLTALSQLKWGDKQNRTFLEVLMLLYDGQPQEVQKMFQNHSLGNYCSWLWTKNFRIFAKIHCNLCFRIVCKLHFRLIIYNDWLALCKIQKVFWKSEVKYILFTVMCLTMTDFGSKRGPLAWRTLWICVRVLLVCDVGYKTLLWTKDSNKRRKDLNKRFMHTYVTAAQSFTCHWLKVV